MRIWLDDVRIPPEENWIWTDNAATCINLLCKLSISEISLDHDLGDEIKNGNGYQVICWIETQTHMNPKYTPPKINIHTANPVAKQKMSAALQSILRKVRLRKY